MSIAARIDGSTGVRVGTRAHTADALVVIDLERAHRQYRALCAAFPGVDVHYDVSALAHPQLLDSIAAAGGGFAVHDEHTLAAAIAQDSNRARRTLYEDPSAPTAVRLAAYDAGVRRFVVSGSRTAAALAALDGVQLLLRIAPGMSVRAARPWPIAGLSLALPPECDTADYVAAITHAIGVLATIGATNAQRPLLLSLGEGFPGGPAHGPSERAELGRAIRDFVAHERAEIHILASAGRAVTAGCLSVIERGVEREADPALASACIDAGADVAVLREPAPILAGLRRVRRHRLHQRRDAGAKRFLRPSQT